MTDSRERPLFTFILFGYNQEQFIREGVAAALAQTYSPLEIILSDDCSKDATFEIMRQMEAEYRGPHKVVLNRTEKNAGFCAHVNHAVKLARGEMIVIAAGDDVSLPHRVEKTFEAWQGSGRQATSIWGAHSITIDEHGKVMDPGPAGTGKFTHIAGDARTFLEKRQPKLYGASHTFNPKLFSDFGPLSPKTVMEDFSLGFRSTLIGSMTIIDEALIKYRRHGSNSSSDNLSGFVVDEATFLASEEKQKKESRQFIGLFAALADDLQTARERKLVSEIEFERLCEIVERQAEYARLRLDIVDASMFRAGWLACKIWNVGGGFPVTISSLQRILPKTLYKKYAIWRGRKARSQTRPSLQPA